MTLGQPDAPATLIEFADLQCPFCAEYTTGALPTVIQDYVRSGRLKMQLRLLRFIGPDSERGAEVAAAATLQDKGWDFSDLFFRNQGQENSGYATDAFLRAARARRRRGSTSTSSTPTSTAPRRSADPPGGAPGRRSSA